MTIGNKACSRLCFFGVTLVTGPLFLREVGVWGGPLDRLSCPWVDLDTGAQLRKGLNTSMPDSLPRRRQSVVSSHLRSIILRSKRAKLLIRGFLEVFSRIIAVCADEHEER